MSASRSGSGARCWTPCAVRGPARQASAPLRRRPIPIPGRSSRGCSRIGPRSTIETFLLEAIARDALGDANAVEHALERALDLSDAEGVLLPFLLHPARGLLERHPRHRTAHASLISEILNLLAGQEPGSRASDTKRLREPLTESETRILRYPPTNLSVQEIAGELYLSANTVKFHIRHLYDKLGAHQRREAVERARALGLLAPSSRGR